MCLSKDLNLLHKGLSIVTNSLSIVEAKIVHKTSCISSGVGLGWRTETERYLGLKCFP